MVSNENCGMQLNYFNVVQLRTSETRDDLEIRQIELYDAIYGGTTSSANWRVTRARIASYLHCNYLYCQKNPDFYSPCVINVNHYDINFISIADETAS